MKLFWRKSHWRYSVKGILHYVSGHRANRVSDEYLPCSKDDQILGLLSYGYKEKSTWIEIQLIKVPINLKGLGHLVKYKGAYEKAVLYF
jgi:hypothetical protein